jgi:glyoxylase-like metal-dependent hydrolase (beta-lactamase superfamily II)
MRAWSMAWNLASLVPETGGTKIVQVRRTGKGCLSYLVGSGREAIVVDPSVRSEVYERLAEKEGWRIVSAVDTHLHADHLSRARAVAARTGAVLRLPACAAVEYAFEPIREGDAIRAGDARIVALDLPGHTPESMGYVVDGRILLTGDTLFVSTVGRPDLVGDGETLVRQAGKLHRSLRKILSLDAGVTLLPAHSSEPLAFDDRFHGASLGEIQDRVKLLGASEEEFVAAIQSKIPPPPPNHEMIMELNRSGGTDGGDRPDLEAGANRCAMP